MIMKKTYPKCPICGKDLKLYKGKLEPIWNEETQQWKGFKMFCSEECKNIQKGKEYARAKHSKACKNKTQLQKDNILKKRKDTCMAKYGVDNPSKVKEIREKISNIKKNADHTLANAKRVDTCMAKYGVKYISQSKEKIEKTKATWRKNYKNGHHMRDEDFKFKIIERRLRSFYQDKIKMSDKFIPLFTEDDWVNTRGATIDELNIVKFKCKTCSTEFQQNLWNGFSMCRCPKCDPYNISKPQQDIEDYLRKYGCDNITQNTKKIITPLELDVFLPEYNVAIEYNGLVFHSFGKSNWSLANNSEELPMRKYHLRNKTNICNDKNINLLQIFENEWLDDIKQEIWKSIILNKVGKTPNRIFARNCEVRKVIDKKVVNEFLENNHLQGACYGNLSYGLYYNEDLLQLFVLGKPRYNKNVDLEIIRISSKRFYNIVGGVSKLFSFIIKHHPEINSILSYSNNRYGNGGIYKNLNFTYIKETSPNYWYFQENSFLLESRLNYQKNKLQYKFDNFKDDLTEQENMFNNGYRIIYDCGNKVFIWNREVQ